MRRRGQTVYLPDGSVPLHPPRAVRRRREPAAGRAAGRRAVAHRSRRRRRAGRRSTCGGRWSGLAGTARLRDACRPTVDAGAIHPAIAALPEVGPLRRALAVRRGAIELELPEQEVVRAAPTGGWTVQVRQAHARRGLERRDLAAHRHRPRRGSCSTRGSACCAPCPPPIPTPSTALREVAQRLGIDWPAGRHRGRAAVRAAPRHAAALALRRAATSLLRGAGYTAFDTADGAPPPADAGTRGHRGAVRARHRAAAAAGRPVRHASCAWPSRPARRCPSGCASALPALPESDGRVRRGGQAVVARACVDRTEAALLADRVGADFDVVVLRGRRPTRRRGRSTCSTRPFWPAAAGRCGRGSTARVRLVEADPVTAVAFAFAAPGSAS